MHTGPDRLVITGPSLQGIIPNIEMKAAKVPMTFLVFECTFEGLEKYRVFFNLYYSKTKLLRHNFLTLEFLKFANPGLVLGSCSGLELELGLWLWLFSRLDLLRSNLR